MKGFLNAIRVLGLRRLLRLARAHRLGWVDTISGFFTTRAMQTLFNVGFFDELQARGHVEVAAFAQEAGLDTRILQELCNYLHTLRILEKNGSAFVLSAKGRTLVEVARGWFDGVYGYEGVFHDLEKLLRKEKTFGADVSRNRGFVSKGSGEIEAWVQFPLAIDVIRRNKYRSVLDLGCREATFLLDLCRETDVAGYGVDLAPEAIVSGERLAMEAGLQDRIKLAVADITRLEQLPDEFRDVDAAITFLLLHEILWYGRDAMVEVLRNFRRLLPDVPFIVFEVIRPTDEEMRARPGMMVQYLLQHELTHQKLASMAEWRDLFRAAGFNLVDEQYYRFAGTAVFQLR